MALEESCKNYLGKTVAVKPEYGWGWTRLDSDIFVPAQINGVPIPFACRVQEFFCFRSELRGFIGLVQQPEHIYNSLFVVVATRVVGTFNFTDNLPRCDVQLGENKPVGEFPEFVSGSPIVNGYGIVGATIERIAAHDERQNYAVTK